MVAALLLFLSALLPGGIFIRKAAGVPSQTFHYFLAFAGSYLIALTLVHIFPEIYQSEAGNLGSMAGLVLGGFFLQMVLEQFSHGIEHGHWHGRKERTIPVFLIAALFVHGMLEGVAVSSPGMDHQHSLLTGILLHKIPASVALVGILQRNITARSRIFAGLLIFALASPFGLLLADVLQPFSWWNTNTMVYIQALIGGNFLYIGGIILFEAGSEGHRLSFKKLLVIVLGLVAALLPEVVGVSDFFYPK